LGRLSKTPEKFDIRPDPNFSDIHNSGPENPDHDMGRTQPVRTRTLDIFGILGLPKDRKPLLDSLVFLESLSQGAKRGRRFIRGLIFFQF
jgi:hypothetical protein